jgi:methyl-accepting chemotaxis protein
VNINAEVLKNFQDITERTNKVSQVVAEIAAASDQQDQGIGQVNKAVEQMNQLTQQNAANAEESASAAEEMSSQSEEMRSMVAGFKLSGSGYLDQARIAKPAFGRQQYVQAGLPKGQKLAEEIAPQPRYIIPLDESDDDVLKSFN